jgi:ParB family chromosome partitioning protein
MPSRKPAARKAPDLSNYFSGAKQSQQLSEAEEEILKLKAEIEELRSTGSSELEAQLKELREQLQSQTGILSIPIEQIEPNPEQPRQTFLPESVESMSRSLKSDGQLQPIILIQREKLLLFDGERRWRSAKALGWQTLQAVIIPEPESLHRKALLTSLHREDLNPLDKAEAILHEIANNTELDANDIPRVLSTVVRRLNTQKRMNLVAELIASAPEKQQDVLASLGLSDYEQAVLSILLDLQLNPASVDANIFPMLSLFDDLKAAIRNGLKGMHAIALQKLSAKNLGVSEEEAHAVRAQTTKKVVEENLSVIATRKLVSEVLASHQTDKAEIATTPKQVSQEVRRLQKLSFDSLKKAERNQLLELQETLRQKLTEIEKILTDAE